MPRNWKKKTERIKSSSTNIKEAVNEVILKGMSLREVATAFNMSKTTLSRYVQEAKQINDLESYEPDPNVGNRKIFSTEEEEKLCEYLRISSQMSYGLTTTQARKLAFHYAEFLGKVPSGWQENEIAGIEWLCGFMSRHKDLSIRTPESTSLSRASSFNRNNTRTFFEKLESLQNKYKFAPADIYNCDETGLSTVTECPKVIAKRGMKQVGQITSAERGQLITMLNFVSASGNTIPPVYIFPRVNYKDFMLENGPTGSLGLAHPSGWMTAANFSQAIEHFVKHSKCTKETPVLLIMDNHDSHISLEVITFAKEHGVVILTLPPHCSHRMQPLDVAVYSPFKMRYRIAQNNWMANHPGKNITIYNIAELSNTAFISAFTKQNIISGFIKTGIYPLNTEIFTDQDFLPAYVTDRPVHSYRPNSDCNIASTSNYMTPEASARTLTNTQISPLSNIRPLPKASPRKTGRRGRKVGSCRILTDTPEKQKIEVDDETKRKKLKSLESKNKSYEKENDSESSVAADNGDPVSKDEIDSDVPDLTPGKISEDDFILIKFSGKKKIYYYVARVLKNEGDSFQVQFLRKKEKTNSFHYTEKEEIYFIDFEDVIMKLPKPKMSGTERTKGLLSFNTNFSQYDMK